MNKEKSLDILNKCLSQISTMSQQEFDAIEKERGLDNLNLLCSFVNPEFEIIFSSIEIASESFISYYDYSLAIKNSQNSINSLVNSYGESQIFALAA